MAPRSQPSPLSLVRLGQTQLPTINRMWEEFGGNTLQVLNSIRGLFNLSSQREAAAVYYSALEFSNTRAGQMALGVNSGLALSDIPIDPNFPIAQGYPDRVRYLVTFELGGEFFSYYEFSQFAPSSRLLDISVAEYIRDHIQHYPRLADILSDNPDEPIAIMVQDIRRRY